MKKSAVVVVVLLCCFLLLIGCQADNLQTKKSYDISNTYFSLNDYKQERRSTVNLKDGTVSYEYLLTCNASSSTSLFEYTAVVKMYSVEDELLESKTVYKKATVAADEGFSFEISVTEDTYYSLSSVVVVFSGKSNDKPEDKFGDDSEKAPTEYKVHFYYNNGRVNGYILVEEGKTVSMPEDPIKENYIFVGWYMDEFLRIKYDFSKPVCKDIVLYAKYEIDALTLTNKISQDTIKGVVKVYNKGYDTFLGFETSSETTQGSGFCFYADDGYYYILTNCHVAKKIFSYDKQALTVEDYQGKQYTAEIYTNKNGTYAMDPKYDLACIYFKASSSNVKALSLVKKNPNRSDDVISVGAPKGQSNTITYGVLKSYERITLSNVSTGRSDVTFDVICHDAYANSGSSGGPLLDADLNVIGVHYAGAENVQREYAIPIEKVWEFLNKYVYI